MTLSCCSGLAALTSVMENIEWLHVINQCLYQETQHRETVVRIAMTLDRCFRVQPPNSWLEGKGE